MRHRLRVVSWVGVCMLIFVGLTEEVHAYLDPGSGSFMFQMLIAAMLGAMYTLKIYWTKIRGVMSRMFKGKRPPKKPSNSTD